MFFDTIKQFHKLYAVNQVDRPAYGIATCLSGEDSCCQEKYTAGLFIMHQSVKFSYFPQADFSVTPISGLQEVEVGAFAQDEVNTWVSGEVVF